MTLTLDIGLSYLSIHPAQFAKLTNGYFFPLLPLPLCAKLTNVLSVSILSVGAQHTGLNCCSVSPVEEKMSICEAKLYHYFKHKYDLDGFVLDELAFEEMALRHVFSFYLFLFSSR